MSLFSELTSIAKEITEEVSKLQAESDILPGTRPYLYGASSKKLKGELDVVKNLSSDLLSKAKSFEDFKKFLDSTEQLLQQKTDAADNFEAYLTKYGYVPAGGVGLPPSASAAHVQKSPAPAAVAATAPFYEFLSPELSATSRHLLANNGAPRENASPLNVGGTAPLAVITEATARPDASSVPSPCRPHTAASATFQPKFQVPKLTLRRPTDDESNAGAEAAVYDDSENACSGLSTQVPAALQNRNKHASPTHPFPPPRQGLASCKRLGNMRKFYVPPRQQKSELGASDFCVRDSVFVTPRTKQNVEQWLKNTHSDEPYSASPMQFHLSRAQTNPLLQNCGELSTPYRTPARTPYAHVGSSASPDLTSSSRSTMKLPLKTSQSAPITASVPKVSATLPLIPTTQSGCKTELNFPAVSSSGKQYVPNEPGIVSSQNFCMTNLNMSLEEPTLSEVTLNALAELKRAEVQQSVSTKPSGQLSQPSDLSNSTFEQPFKAIDQPIDYSCKVLPTSSNSFTTQKHSVTDDGVASHSQTAINARLDSKVDLTARFERIGLESENIVDMPEEPEMISRFSKSTLESSKCLGKVDTPEEPVLSHSTQRFDTPEEPILSDSHASVSANALPPTEKFNIPAAVPVERVIPQANTVQQTPRLNPLLKQPLGIRSENLHNLLFADLEKSPELSETTQQLFSNRSAFTKDHLVPTKSDSHISNRVTHVSNKENCNTLPRVPLGTMEKKIPLESSMSFKSKDAYFERPDGQLDRSCEPSSRTLNNFDDTMEELDDTDDAQLSYLKSSRSLSLRSRPAVDNSFSQAMLQYSHVPASPMPPPLTPLTNRERYF